MRPNSTHPILTLLSNPKLSLQNIFQIHTQFLTSGLHHHTFPLSHLLAVATRLSPLYAISILTHHLYPPTTFLFNTLLSSLSHLPLLTLSLYSEFIRLPDVFPNHRTYPSLLKSLSFLTVPRLSWIWGGSLHAHIFKYLGGPHECFVGAALIGFYSNFGEIQCSREVFDEMPSQDLATWNTMLIAYSHAATSGGISVEGSIGNEVFGLFREMQLHDNGIFPDEISLVAFISVCGDVCALAQGAWAHAYAIRGHQVMLNKYVGTALVEMYCKCGRIDLAEQVFDEMPVRDVTCYNAMICGHATYGSGRGALAAYERMLQEGVHPNDATMVAIISACAHSGLVEDGRRLFDSIKDSLSIEPKVEHYCCLIDLFGRAGLIEEAFEVVRGMPMEPTAIIYRSLLGSCRVHDKSKLVEHTLKGLMELDPEYGGNYVILSNLYATKDKWDDVKRVRSEMRDKGIVKTPGVSSIEVDGVVHEFLTRDRSSILSKEIYDVVDDIGRRLVDHEQQHISLEL